MPAISLTEFIDFVLKIGTAKVNKVASIKAKLPYNPATDHWRQLRSHITDYHENKVDSLSFSGTSAREKKERTYKLAIKGYKKFLVSHPYEYFKPHKAKWTHTDLTVSVNPEVGFIVGDRRLLVKLYMKEEKLTKARINTVLAIMRSSFPVKIYDVAVLDMIRGTLYDKLEKNLAIEALLAGEAATFLAIWNSIENE